MDSTSKSPSNWLPKGAPACLAAPSPAGKPERDQYLSSLRQHLQRLIDQDQQEAQQALQMSQENAPELWEIAEQYPASQWASQLVRSDRLNSLLPAAWAVSPVEPEPYSLQEVLEALA